MNMREEFEKWFKEKFEVPDFVFSDFDESAGEYSYTDETEELYINITMMFEAWQAAQPKWIKCSDQMPEAGEGGVYLVYDGKRTYLTTHPSVPRYCEQITHYIQITKYSSPDCQTEE